ncbi:MAG: metallophosphoesterase family protein [Anaerolineae bacterium]
MRIATFSDIHGNLNALEVVLDQIEREKPDAIYCLGDLVGYGAYPNEVIKAVSARAFPTIMGNYDDGVGFDRENCGCAYTTEEARALGDISLHWTRDKVNDSNKALLRSLLPFIRLQCDGKSILLVHGSPRRINEYVYEDRSVASLERIAASANADLLVFGHTHLPYIRQVGGTLFVNDGSVGKPKDGDPRAAFVLLEIGSTIKATIKRVSYDAVAAAAAVRANGLPEHYADVLLTAQG